MFKQRFNEDGDDGEKIVLDQSAFKALASDTRVDILKLLDQRRKTLTELSEDLKLSVATVKEHLGNLVSAELVLQKDEGRKWKYYELTTKGSAVLYPEKKKIWILLVTFLFVIGFTFVGSFFNLGDVYIDNPNSMMMSLNIAPESARSAMILNAMDDIDSASQDAEMYATGGEIATKMASDTGLESIESDISEESISAAVISDDNIDGNIVGEISEESGVIPETVIAEIEPEKIQKTNYVSYALVFADIVVVLMLGTEIVKFYKRKIAYKRHYNKLLRKIHN